MPQQDRPTPQLSIIFTLNQAVRLAQGKDLNYELSKARYGGVPK